MLDLLVYLFRAAFQGKYKAGQLQKAGNVILYFYNHRLEAGGLGILWNGEIS